MDEVWRAVASALSAVVGVKSFLDPPALFVGGWLAAHAEASLTRRFELAFAGFVALAISLLAISGVTPREPVAQEAHRWFAHGLIILIWQVVPFCMGANLRRAIPKRLGLAFASLVLLSFAGVSFLAITTGYLSPHRDSAYAATAVGEETANRFFILHCVAIPTVLICLTGLWFCLAAHRGKGHASGANELASRLAAPDN